MAQTIVKVGFGEMQVSERLYGILMDRCHVSKGGSYMSVSEVAQYYDADEPKDPISPPIVTAAPKTEQPRSRHSDGVTVKRTRTRKRK